MTMMFRAAFVLMAACGLLAAQTPAMAGTLQCAPYARQISGIQLFGRAADWWAQAEGRYDRGQEPRVGAVLAFAASGAMPAGHVAMVSQVVSPREVRLTHANWSYRGGIERDVRAIDVSAANDWSDVKVWYGPTGALGTRSNPARGFIYAQAPAAADRPVQIAAAAGTTALN
ncbi:CHAP domain-containing protein [Sphingobium algorifonticola]